MPSSGENVGNRKLFGSTASQNRQYSRSCDAQTKIKASLEYLGKLNDLKAFYASIFCRKKVSIKLLEAENIF
jgi:hypothetical protein